MATAENVQTLSATAGAVVSIYRFVALQTDGKFDHAGTQGRADGVSAEAAAADGDLFAMAQMQGVMKVEVGATLATPGLLIASDSVGRAIVALATGGEYVLGTNLDAGVLGDIVRVLLHSPSQVDA